MYQYISTWYAFLGGGVLYKTTHTYQVLVTCVLYITYTNTHIKCTLLFKRCPAYEFPFG